MFRCHRAPCPVSEHGFFLLRPCQVQPPFRSVCSPCRRDPHFVAACPVPPFRPESTPCPGAPCRCGAVPVRRRGSGCKAGGVAVRPARGGKKRAGCSGSDLSGRSGWPAAGYGLRASEKPFVGGRFRSFVTVLSWFCHGIIPPETYFCTVNRYCETVRLSVKAVVMRNYRNCFRPFGNIPSPFSVLPKNPKPGFPAFRRMPFRPLNGSNSGFLPEKLNIVVKYVLKSFLFPKKRFTFV